MFLKHSTLLLNLVTLQEGCQVDREVLIAPGSLESENLKFVIMAAAVRKSLKYSRLGRIEPFSKYFSLAALQQVRPVYDVVSNSIKSHIFSDSVGENALSVLHTLQQQSGILQTPSLTWGVHRVGAKVCELHL